MTGRLTLPIKYLWTYGEYVYIAEKETAGKAGTK
jgi:hypothetical protein